MGKSLSVGRQESSIDTSNLQVLDMEVPDDVLLEILLRVPARDVVKSCILVCKHWLDIIDSKSFWKHRCVALHGYSRKLTHLLANENFKKLYFSNPYQSNLILDHCAEGAISTGRTMKHWTITSEGGNKWKIETPTGCEPIVDYTHDVKTKDVKCWVTSYSACSKEQTIDLLERGCSTYILDEVRPDICISEWYAGRFDCSMVYSLKVYLLNENKQKIDKFKFETTEPAGTSWYKVEHRFSNYKPGVRFIRYQHSGQDQQFWAGWYGAKMTLSNVTLDFTKLNSEPGPCEES